MKKLGFGCMRLPMMGGADGEVDKREFCRMVDTFLAEGFCYFRHGPRYLNGKSETALRECLTARYPRESYILTDKLTSFFFEKEDDIRLYLSSSWKKPVSPISIIICCTR